MRQNLIIALLAVCATLLAVNLALSVRTVPFAEGQSVGQGGGMIMATAVNQSGSQNTCFIFDPATKVLAAYTIKNMGIDLVGSRKLIYDMNLSDKVDEIVPRGAGHVSPTQVKEILEKNQ